MRKQKYKKENENQKHLIKKQSYIRTEEKTKAKVETEAAETKSVDEEET